ncbi:hypothetical protein QR685DRAFT_524518 [Neurospora intermedia]|uniref:Copper transporter n=1 Tax=Neurospora intermedia TaxID=5142 RepID=A0ABR3DDI3_NEUIN
MTVKRSMPSCYVHPDGHVFQVLSIQLATVHCFTALSFWGVACDSGFGTSVALCAVLGVVIGWKLGKVRIFWAECRVCGIADYRPVVV